MIPELARWEDWSVIHRLEDLFIEANPDIEFIRVPIVRYLRACPLPEASEAIERLKRVDPQAIQRADTFFIGGFSNAPLADTSAEHEPALVARVDNSIPSPENTKPVTRNDAESSTEKSSIAMFWSKWGLLAGGAVIVTLFLRRHVLLTSAGTH